MSLSGRAAHAIFRLALRVGYRNNIINGDQKTKEMAFLIWYTSTGLRNVLNNITENVHTQRLHMHESRTHKSYFAREYYRLEKYTKMAVRSLDMALIKPARTDSHYQLFLTI